MSGLCRQVQHTRNGVLVSTYGAIKLTQLQILLNLLDSEIAEQFAVEGEDMSDLTANLYSARHHIMRAIKIQEAA